MDCRVPLPKAILVSVENVMFIEIGYESLLHKFFQEFGEERKKTNGTIVGGVVFIIGFVYRNNFGCFHFIGDYTTTK